MFNIARAWIIINALIFSGIGILTLFAPNVVTKAIGFKFIGPQAQPELMASYGGLLIALAILLILGIHFCGVLLVVQAMTIIYSGYALGRVIGIVTSNAAIDKTTATYLIFEISATTISLLLSLIISTK